MSQKPTFYRVVGVAYAPIGDVEQITENPTDKSLTVTLKEGADWTLLDFAKRELRFETTQEVNEDGEFYQMDFSGNIAAGKSMLFGKTKPFVLRPCIYLFTLQNSKKIVVGDLDLPIYMRAKDQFTDSTLHLYFDQVSASPVKYLTL